jgi:hypothetical protein
MCGTPEFVAPEVVNYDFIDAATGIHKLYKTPQSLPSCPLIRPICAVFSSHLSNPFFLALSSVQSVPSFPPICPIRTLLASHLSNLYCRSLLCVLLSVQSFPLICPHQSLPSFPLPNLYLISYYPLICPCVFYIQYLDYRTSLYLYSLSLYETL